MTVQILPAYDSHPPKFRYLPQFEMTKGRRRYLKVLLGFVVVTTLINGVLYPASFFEGLKQAILIVLVLQIPVLWLWLIVFKYKLKASNGTSLKSHRHIHDYYKQAFLSAGYQIDYETTGLLIDIKQKKLGFTVSNAGFNPSSKQFTKMLVCDYTDVRSWSAGSQDITERVNGKVSRHDNTLQGTTTYYTTPDYDRVAVTTYGVKVTLAYPDSPLQAFEANSEADAQQWVARLDSLING